MKSPILDYFGNIQIIHLKHRTDRFALLEKELNALGISMNDTRVDIPNAPIVADKNGFTSTQVYGNFLSHLNILKHARDQKWPSVLILEDDAIFRSILRKNDIQQKIVQQLDTLNWDMLFLGHPLKDEISSSPPGFIQTSEEFKWAHCYAVSQSALPELIDYLEATIIRPRGDPKGGKMYIDGAFSLYRRHAESLSTVIHNPALSIQRGSPSGIANQKWYDKHSELSPLINITRRLRDEFWRHTGKSGAR